MKAVGITCGIGSMLVGARRAGFEIAGNVEWRKYYHAKDPDGRNTFEENFPGAVFPNKLDQLPDDEIDKLMGLDLALGHPECGNYSTLSHTAQYNRSFDEMNADPGDIPLFTELVDRLRPRFFVMDDLPKSFIGYPMEEYHKALPDYDLFPEWISNWGYGNVQKYRNRFFMIGALKDERWAFRPGEREHTTSLADVLDLLPVWPTAGGNMPNHLPHTLVGNTAKGKGIYGPNHMQWAELKRWFEEECPEGGSLKYISDSGEKKTHVGFRKAYWEKPGGAPVISGGVPLIHPIRNLPLTIRERARVQGFPDEFIFYREVVDADGQWNHYQNMHLVKQTGKAMPVQFCEYVSRQVAAAVQGEDWECSDQRVIKPNEYVSAAKSWYCENVGYADQERACASCWLYRGCTIRARRYQIGEPAVGQRDAFDPGVVPVPGEPSPEAPRPTPGPKKPAKVFIPPAGRSKIRGTRPGVGRRMEELIRADRSVDEILMTIHAEFPGTAANETDVAKVRSKMQSKG